MTENNLGMDTEVPKVRFDSTINLGQVITAISMVLSVIAAYYALKSDIQDHETRITRTEKDLARQFDALDKTVDSLSSIKQDIAVIRDRFERKSPQ